MKEIIIGLASIAFLALVFYVKPNVVNPMDIKVSDDSQPAVNTSPTVNNKTKQHSHSTTVNSSSSQKKSLSSNTHLDQLTPEMKQALRGKLLFNAPIETVERADGSVILKTNGRVTHMPVAVQMPDGSIQIKEYSYIPDDK